jgi:hypothetical protein
MTAVAIVVALACVGAAWWFGLADRLSAAYADSSLRWRVRGLAKARMAGDLAATSRFVIRSCEPRASLGTFVRYLAFEVEDVERDGDVARVKIGMDYKLALPGLAVEADPPQRATAYQRWVRVAHTWYWDPGPASEAVSPARLRPTGAGQVPAPPRSAPLEPGAAEAAATGTAPVPTGEEGAKENFEIRPDRGPDGGVGRSERSVPKGGLRSPTVTDTSQSGGIDQ